MKIPATNRSLFHQKPETVLTRGLHTMTLACEALILQNTVLNDQIKALTEEILQGNNKV